MVSHKSFRRVHFLHSFFFFLIWLNNLKWSVFKFRFFLLPDQVWCWTPVVNFSIQLWYFWAPEFVWFFLIICIPVRILIFKKLFSLILFSCLPLFSFSSLSIYRKLVLNSFSIQRSVFCQDWFWEILQNERWLVVSLYVWWSSVEIWALETTVPLPQSLLTGSRQGRPVISPFFRLKGVHLPWDCVCAFIPVPHKFSCF